VDGVWLQNFMSEPSSEIDVLILGAGLSGLYAGLLLARAGKTVAILEREDGPGGLTRGHHFAGNYVDFGVNPIYVTEPELLRDVQGLLALDGLEVVLDNRIRWGGEDRPYPMSRQDFGKGLTFGQKMGNFWGGIGSGGGGKPPKDAETYLKKLYGGSLYNLYFKEFGEKFWEMDLAEMSPLLVVQKIPPFLKEFAEVHGKNNHSALPEERKCQFSPGGAGALTRAMAQEIARLGGTIAYGAEVVELEVDKNLVRSVTWKDLNVDPEEGNNMARLQCNSVISTIPVRSLVKCFGTNAPAQAHASSLHLFYRPLLAYTFLVRKPKCLDGYSTRFRDRSFFRLSEPKNAGQEIKPEGHTLLIAEMTAKVDSPAWKGDEEVWTNLLQELKDEGICNRDEVSNRNVIRNAHAFPVYRKEFEEHREKLAAYFRRYDNLECAGSTGTFTFQTVEESLGQAATVAARIQTALSVTQSNTPS